jgi:hypothetical protein
VGGGHSRASDERAGFCGATTYVRGGRLRLPPRGKTYQRARATTITAAAMATMAIVEAARITRPLYHLDLRAKRWAAAAQFFGSAGSYRRRGRQRAYSSIPVVSLRQSLIDLCPNAAEIPAGRGRG